jgi:hypothetical protein
VPGPALRRQPVPFGQLQTRRQRRLARLPYRPGGLPPVPRLLLDGDRLDAMEHAVGVQVVDLVGDQARDTASNTVIFFAPSMVVCSTWITCERGT